MNPITFKIIIGRDYVRLMKSVAHEIEMDPEWRMQGPSQQLGKVGCAQVLQKGNATGLVSIAAVKQGDNHVK